MSTIVDTLESVYEVDRVQVNEEKVLTVYRTRVSSPLKLIIANAMLPASYFFPLIEYLGDSAQLITWDPHGLFDDDISTPINLSSFDHASDADAILDHYEISSAFVGGYCAGAEAALALAYRRPERVKKLLLFNGAYNIENEVRSPDSLALDVVCEQALKSVDQARLYYSMLHNANHQGNEFVEKGKTSNDIARYASDELKRLIEYPYAQGGYMTLYKAAHIRAGYRRSKIDSWCKEVRVRSVVFAGQSDRMASLHNARELANLLPNSCLRLRPGDHYILYTDPEMQRLVKNELLDEIAA